MVWAKTETLKVGNKSDLKVAVIGTPYLILGIEFYKAYISAIKKKAEDFWENIKGEQSERQTRTRDEAVQEYKYRGVIL